MRLKTAAVRIAGIRTRTTAGESLNCGDMVMMMIVVMMVMMVMIMISSLL